MVSARPIDERLVLVVDDDPGIRESMTDLLHTKGYSVLQAENGQRALDILKKIRTSHVWWCWIWQCRSWTVADSSSGVLTTLPCAIFR
jgi:CheY-like chemotaxis protein